MKCFRAPKAPVLPAPVQRQSQRDPLLMSEISEDLQPQRFARARIVQETSQTKYLAERPRGLAKGEYSSALQGSFSIGQDTAPDFTPGRRLIDNPNPLRPEKVSRKKFLHTQDHRDPITQTDPAFQVEPVRPRSAINWRPSPVVEYENQRKVLLPAELGFQNPEFYDKRNKSSVFSEESEPLPSYGKKRIPEKQEEAPGLVEYRYALPYRDERISEKPQKLQGGK